MNDTDKETILQCEQAIFAAIRQQDAQALGQLLTADFVYRSPGHEEVARADFLKLATTMPIKILALWGEELRVNFYGDAAVLTGLQLAKTDDGKGGEALSAVMFTDVFVPQDGRWLLALAYAVDLPQVPEKYR